MHWYMYIIYVTQLWTERYKTMGPGRTSLLEMSVCSDWWDVLPWVKD